MPVKIFQFATAQCWRKLTWKGRPRREKVKLNAQPKGRWALQLQINGNGLGVQASSPATGVSWAKSLQGHDHRMRAESWVPPCRLSLTLGPEKALLQPGRRWVPEAGPTEVPAKLPAPSPRTPSPRPRASHPQ